MTLIEVLAGLIVLGTVLSGILIARNRFAQQLATANLKLSAAQQVDRLIEGWMGSAFGPPPRSTGKFDQRLAWRTTEVREPAARKLGSRIVRLEVFDLETLQRDDAQPKALLSVDLLVADPAMRRMAEAIRPSPMQRKGPTSQPGDAGATENQPTTVPTSQPTEDQVYEDPRLLDGIYLREK